MKRAAVLLLCASVLLSGCIHVSRHETQLAAAYAEHARSAVVECAAGCLIDSPLLALGDATYAGSSPGHPSHSVILLDDGQDSLLARVHLIRAARSSIDLQTFHFEGDDAGRVVLDELIAAARRGVRVRLLLDHLNGLADPVVQARLASYHRNFELRLYNPVFSQARVNPLEFTGAIVFRLRDLNRRMHSKMMVVDERVAIIGGRNIQDEYFDWNPISDYRDRDLLVAGPVTAAMERNFNAFWSDRRALPPVELADVARVLLANHGPPAAEPTSRSARVAAMAAAARDGAAVYARLSPHLYRVGRVEFFADLPSKHDDVAQSRLDASQSLLDVLAGAKRELVLQTPYMLLSRTARKLFRQLHARAGPPAVLVSTNSLAATDALPVYAMSYKYKRLYLRELGFQIYEFKPFPEDMPAILGALPEPAQGGPEHRGLRGAGRGPVPLKRPGVRIGLHSKSMVVDEEIAIVGSHNFDPRSNDWSTESLVMVHDPVFARALASSIRRDMAPGNAWVIAPKPKLPVLFRLNYNLGKLSEKLPVFDVWPFPYATSYQLKPGCQPLPPSDPGFQACYQVMGDFPEVNVSLKMIYTRILTVFGAGFIPFL